MTWGTVTHRAERVLVLAQGPSFAQVKLSDVEQAQARGAFVVAVNQSIRYYPKPNAWITMDPSKLNRAMVAEARDGVAYYMAVPPHYGQPDAPVKSHRKTPEPWVTYLLRMSHLSTLSEHPGRIHSKNSGRAALDLAYLMDAKRVALLGVDGQGANRWDGTENGNLDDLSVWFRAALPQLEARGVEVVNGSPLTAVDCFPVMDPAEALAWLVD